MNDRELLSHIAFQLRKWANESRTGGWSTHQVDPQRKLADQIDDHLAAAAQRAAETARINRAIIAQCRNENP